MNNLSVFFHEYVLCLLRYLTCRVCCCSRCLGGSTDGLFSLLDWQLNVWAMRCCLRAQGGESPIKKFLNKYTIY